MILATKSSAPIIGQVASVMGWIMDGIYKLLSVFGIHNLGLCIIIFSIIVYILMTPLQVKQQKFSKLSAIMQPELQKVQKKYQGKKDQVSMQKMQEETQAIYEKYGVSPTGSCLQLAIQFPVLMALWQVIYKIPAYVGSVREIFADAVSNIVTVNGYTDLIQKFITDNNITRVQLILDENKVATSDSIVDFLYALSPAQWTELSGMSQFSKFSGVIDQTAVEISKMQNFLGLNIADQPLNYIKAALSGGAIALGIMAVMIPFLAWLTQMLNIKLMPQAAQQNNDQSAMMSSMKTMNTVMPIMSAVFCFTFPVGLGIYWIASAVVRSVQQFAVNKYMDKIKVEDLIQENVKKMEKRREKAGLPPQKITNQAHQNAKRVNIETNSDNSKKVQEAYQKAANAKPGSIAAKANMVRDFEERNKKK